MECFPCVLRARIGVSSLVRLGAPAARTGTASRLHRIAALLLLACLGAAPMGAAADTAAEGLARGVAAYRAGQYREARHLLAPLADQGDLRAQVLMGKMYAAGRGGVMDGARAADYFYRAALRGAPEAQYAMGRMYESGWGVVADPDKAVQWFRKAAEQGHARARERLAALLAKAEAAVQPTSKESAQAPGDAAHGAPAGAERMAADVPAPDQGAAEAPASGTEPERAAEAPAARAAAESAQAEPPGTVQALDEPARDKGAGQTPATVAEALQAGGEAGAWRPYGEAWVRAQDAGAYSIQLLGSWREEDVLHFIEAHGLEGETVAYFLSERRGRPWYNLIYGAYGGLKAAREARAALPEALKKGGPWIRRFSDIQGSLLAP
jgi:septal ring-binding cell division protein DamX